MADDTPYMIGLYIPEGATYTELLDDPRKFIGLPGNKEALLGFFLDNMREDFLAMSSQDRFEVVVELYYEYIGLLIIEDQKGKVRATA